MAEELLARAESNGYKRGAHREEDDTRDNRKHNDKIKRDQNAVLGHYCRQGRRARLAIDFSTGCVCVSHASSVLGVCVMITSALQSYRD